MEHLAAPGHGDRGVWSFPIIIISTAPDSFNAASDELRSVRPAARVHRLGPGTGGLELAGAAIADTATVCRHQPIVFVRHLMQGMAGFSVPATDHERTRIASAAMTLLGSDAANASIALQVWTDTTGAVELRADELRRVLATRLAARGVPVSRGGADKILGLCVTDRGAILGLTAREDALSDWPGGRVGPARDPEQISRAELKLDELFHLLPLPLPAGGTALDLGASPGGWTRLLRRAGLIVWAVDPAALDPRLADDAGIHHVRTTAGRFLAETNRTFDLIVNDVRMAAPLSCQIMVTAAAHLRSGRLAIMTLKLGSQASLPTVRDGLRTLQRAYTIVQARQLFHNRHEVTVVARRR